MHETADDIAALQRLLDDSYASAGHHLKSIHLAEKRLSAEEVCERLKGVCVLDLATVSATCAPFVAPVDGLFLRGKFWFGSAASSQRFRHIRTNPRVSAAHTLGEELSFLVHGTAHEADAASGEFDYVRDYCLEVYGPTYAEWGLWGKEPYAWIEPSKMFATKLPTG